MSKDGGKLDQYISGIREDFKRRQATKLESNKKTLSSEITITPQKNAEIEAAKLLERMKSLRERCDTQKLTLSIVGQEIFTERLAPKFYEADRKNCDCVRQWKPFFMEDYKGREDMREEDQKLWNKLTEEHASEDEFKKTFGMDKRGKKVVNVQNVDYKDLSQSLKSEYRERAKFIINFLFTEPGTPANALSTPEFLGLTASLMYADHIAKSEVSDRNSILYFGLSEEEKNRYRLKVVLTLESYLDIFTSHK